MSHPTMADATAQAETPRTASAEEHGAAVRISRPPSWLEAAEGAAAVRGEAVVIGLPRRKGNYVQGTLPLQLPSSSWSREAASRLGSAAQIRSSFAGNGLRLVDSLTDPAVHEVTDSLFDAQRTPRSELPDPREWAARLGQAIIEVLDGRRSSSQLLRWTTPEIHRALRSQAGSLAQTSDTSPSSAGPGRVQVRSVHVCEPESGIAEVSVVLATPRRTRAMAMRLEGVDGRWRATVVMLA